MEDCVLCPQLSPYPATESATLAWAQSGRVIRILHPGYSGGANRLLVLNATGGRSGGIHYATVLCACFIISGNRHDGYLSRSNSPTAKALNIEFHKVLPRGSYYFHVPAPREHNAAGDGPTPPLHSHGGQAYCWLVVPKFREWQPPAVLPLHWQQLLETPEESPTATTGLCRVTRRGIPTERAHIIPESELHWFGISNVQDIAGQDTEASSTRSINKPQNLIRLSRDVRWLFDHKYMTFLPKLLGPDKVSLAVHVLNSTEEEVIRLFHGVQLHAMTWVPAHYLYSRFARSLFPSLAEFLLEGRPREALLWDASAWAYHPSQSLSSIQLKGLLGKKDRSTSSTERPRSVTGPAVNGSRRVSGDVDSGTSVEDLGWNSDGSTESGGSSVSTADMEQGGRKRSRTEDL